MTKIPPTDLPPDVLPLVPMRNVVLFPHVMVPIGVGRPRSVEAVAHAVACESPVVLVLQKNADVDDPGRDDLCEVGTLARVIKAGGADAPIRHVACQGLQRVRLGELVDGHPFLAVRVQRIEEPAADADAATEAEALALTLRERAAELLSLLPGVPAELAHALQGTHAAAHLADLVASVIDIELAEKQALLEMLPTAARLRKLLDLVTHRIQVLRLSQEIGERTKEQIDDRQRRFLLREQLRTIQRELGEEEEADEDLKRLETAIEKAQMPAEAEAQARKELQRLARAPEGSSEGTILRTWLEWMTELPWREPEPLHIDLAEARRTLAEAHFGLDDIKRRIVEFLAVKKLNPAGRAPILCFVGPPGVGKTSLGQSIAQALERPFVRVSLGGVHDEAEIRGHRRTYIGAMPGHIVQGLRKAGARDAVMMLDEVDKMSPSLHGDPSAALLEVLDPEQNATFRDNYLGLPFDLSRVVFLCTANVIDQVPAPVRDRMEVIELPGYTLEEKLRIAERYLVPRQRTANGLAEGQVVIDEPALRALVAGYTREAGVRQLEREIGRAMRHAAMAVAEGAAGPVTIGADDLDRVLGAVKFEHEAALRTPLAGVATGLAWTPVGGDILFIEATRVPGAGRLLMTGQLGDVMKESAQAALTLVKSRAADLGVGAAVLDASDVHLHVPAGAIPKDGPSAGVAMFVALSSLFTRRPVRHDVAMTGEISLRGLVLPVGGIKEKVLAAQRAGVAEVLVPARNAKDLRDVPETVRATIRFTLLETVDDALRAALRPETP